MKVLLVDDHPVFRSGVARLMETVYVNPEVLQAGDGRSAVELARGRRDLDLALVDLTLPGGMGGLAVVAQLRNLLPRLPIVVLSGSEGPEQAQAALEHGATAFLSKAVPAATIVDTLRRLAPDATAPRTASDGPDQGGLVSLTARQLDVLALICQGASNKEICATLGLAEQTVKGHVSAIFRALGVNNRTQAVLAAGRLGFASATS